MVSMALFAVLAHRVKTATASEVPASAVTVMPTSCPDGLIVVNHQYDFPGQMNYGCVSPDDPCRTEEGLNGVHCLLVGPMLSAPAYKQTRYPNNFGKCEGKCQRDSDCLGSLVCYTTHYSGTHVPGCTGTTDVIGTTQGYCIDPTFVEKLGSNNILEIIEPTFVADTDTLIMYGKVRQWSEAPPEVPFGTCVGGCGANSHCRDGLECFPAWGQGNPPKIPGCEGERLSSHIKYCYDKNWKTNQEIAANEAAALTASVSCDNANCNSDGSDCEDWSCKEWCDDVCCFTHNERVYEDEGCLTDEEPCVCPSN